MALDKKLFKKEAAAAATPSGTGNQEEGLILHLDANDVDSYDGDGSVWYDISEHDVTIPLSDNADDLKLHLNASDTTSYDPATDTTTWTDISGNSNDATLVSLTNTDHDIDNGGFFTFDSSNDYATIPHSTDLDISNSFTVEAWVNRDDDGEGYIAVKQGGSGAYGYFLQFHNNTSWGYTFQIYTTGNASYRALATIANSGTAGEWQHVVGTCDGSNIKLYVDGELLATTAISGTVATNTAQTVIGAYANYAGKWDGKIGAVRIYQKTLSASEVGQNYRHGRDYIYTSLIDDTDLELHFDAASYSGSGSTWTADVGNDGTITGATYDQEIGDWFDFDGSGDVVTSAGNITTTDRDFTVEAWVRPDSTSTSQNFFEVEDTSGTNKISMVVNTGSKFRCYIYQAASQNNSAFPTSTTAFTTGKWYHIAVTFEQDVAAKIYVNGVLEATSTTNVTGNRPQTYGETNLGDGAFGDFNGGIGQYRFYSSVLTADEVMQNYLFTKNNYPNGYNGTNSGVTWNSDGYFDFDGSNDYVHVSGATTGLVRSIQSWQMWIKPDVINTTQFPLAIGNGQHRETYFYIESDGTYQGAIGGARCLSTTAFPSTSAWTHVAMTVNSSNNAELYVNGTKIDDSADFSTDEPVYDLQANLFLGARYNNNTAGLGVSGLASYRYNGKITNLKFYDRPITSAEISAAHTAGSGQS